MDSSDFKQERDLSTAKTQACTSTARGTGRIDPKHTVVTAGDFVPRIGLRSGHLQTLVSHFLPRRDRLPSAERRQFRVSPEVQILCCCHWQADRRHALTALIVHGLEGSSDSQYIIGTANKAWAAGMNVVRMNVRNCGGSDALAPTLYHSGLSADIAGVVRELTREEGLKRVALAGFSMGGNQVLKLAGEWGSGSMGPTPARICAVAAISPAVDLSASADALHLPSNRLYEWRFLLSLRHSVSCKARLFPEAIHVDRRWWSSIRNFDDSVTAPHFGFRDAEDYYQQASASPVLDRVTLPALIIHAKDDPFVRLLPETRARILANPNICFIETEHGGHCGFLAASTDGYDGRWAEQQILEFFKLNSGE